MAETAEVSIVDFAPEYAKAFRDLNEEWISKLFKMEEADFVVLDHPQEHIIDNGGYIPIALMDGKPVGTCALVKLDDSTFKLVKMGVTPQVHGKGIGKNLCQHAIKKAKELGATRVYLESNRSLIPAITMYEKLGFKEVQGFVTQYERVDIAMELML